MVKRFLLVFFVLVAQTAFSIDDAEIQVVQKNAKRISTAVYDRDIDAIMELTHQKVFELFGGKENMKRSIKQLNEKYKKDQLKLVNFEFPKPPIFYKGKINEFVFVPTLSCISINGKLLENIYRKVELFWQLKQLKEKHMKLGILL